MSEKNPAVERAAEFLNEIPKFTKEKHSGGELRRMLAILGADPGKHRIIHVAGTNGKGSVCAFLSSILMEAGYRTAVFTSPHLVSVKERFVFDGRQVEDSLFLEAFSRVKEAAPAFEKERLGFPSYFEYLFFMFMMMVEREPVDYVILETGLGGRLDATNCVEKPLLTVITSISLDHMEYLGDTVAKIAGEKAGILKPGVPVVYDHTSEEASAVIEARAGELGCPCWPVDASSFEALTLSDGKLHLNPAGSSRALTIPFPAEYQAVNGMLAFRAAGLLGLSEEIIGRGMEKTRWPGRMEQVLDGVYVDGGHNEGGIRAFSRAAVRIAGDRQVLLLFAVSADKEYGRMIEELYRTLKPRRWILTQMQGSRALNTETLRREALLVCGEEYADRLCVVPSSREALALLLQEKGPEDVAFCVGSLYLAGEIEALFAEKN